MGSSGRWFLFLVRLPLDEEEGFLGRVVELVFLGVTAGFFCLMIFTVDLGVAAVVKGFLLVVEDACVVLKPDFDGTV